MLALRSPGHSPNRGKRPRRQAKAAFNNNDVIVLSDDSDTGQPPIKRKSTKSKKKPIVLSKEVVEISSSDDEPGPSKDTTKDGRIAALSNELATSNKLVKETKAQVASLQAILDKAPKHAGTNIAMDELEDAVTCEICADKMWSPYMLPECGHTYCMTCIVDWFNTTLNHHRLTHPNYDVNRLVPAHHEGLLTQPLHFYAPHLHPQIHQIRAMYNVVHPEYTCPTCRKTVKTPPAENYSLKAIVNLVAAAQKEKNTIKHSAARAKHNPWAAFFKRGN